VLVVEDELAIRELLRLHLELAGFVLEETGDGRRALDAARARPFDLILLDVMLPGLDGVSLCQAIRRDGPNTGTPILMVTARDGEADTVVGLESGADDYVTKPFGVRELMARVSALVRRHERAAERAQPVTAVHTAQLSLDRDRRQAMVRGAAVELTRQEFESAVSARRAAGPGVQPLGAAAAGVERRHLRHRADRRHRDQPVATQDRARPTGSGKCCSPPGGVGYKFSDPEESS
jgi:DNA-binding response OmpR family regulator